MNDIDDRPQSEHRAQRIEAVTAHEVVVPAMRGAIDSEDGLRDPHGYGRWDQMPIVLLEVRSSDGHVGLGEVVRGWTISALEPWLKQLPGLPIAGPAIALEDLPADWRPRGVHGGALRESQPPALWSAPAPLWSAVEVALLDLTGKRLGCRVVDLLGGAVRQRVSVDYWAGRQTPSDLGRTVARARERGFNGIKTKGRLGDPVIEQAHAILDAGGDTFEWTLDPMFQWLSPQHAWTIMRALGTCGLSTAIYDACSPVAREGCAARSGQGWPLISMLAPRN